MNMKAFGVSVLLALSLAGAARAQDRIIAIVNNEVITQKDMDSFTTFTRIQLSQKLSGQALEDKLASMKKDLLQRLIEDKLILQEAKKSEVKVDDSRVKAKMSEIKKRYDSDKEFNDALVQQGLSAGDVEARIKDQMMMYSLIDSKIRSKIQVKPTEITAYYQENKQEMVTPERREVASLSAETEDAAKELGGQLRQGRNMDALAVERKIKVNSFTSQPGELKKEADEAIFSLKAGDVSDPVNVNGAYYVFVLKKVLPSESRSLIDVQDQISDVLFEKKMQEAVAAWVDGIRKTAYIKITE